MYQNKKTIEVSTIIGFDNIKIIATFKNNRGENITIHDEKIDILFLSKKHHVKKEIKNIIGKIEKKTSTKIDKINVIFDDFMKNSELIKIKTTIHTENTEFNNDEVLTSKNCEGIIQAMIQECARKYDDLVLISVIPFRFNFVDKKTSTTYDSSIFPVGKSVSKLTTYFSIRYLDKKTYLKVYEWFDSMNIKIYNIALESQLSIYEGEIQDEVNNTNFVLAIKKNKTVLITYVNNIVIRSDELNYSYENLLKKIEENFEISYQEAKNLVDCYGNLKLDENDETIYSSCSINNKSSKPIKKSEITQIIKSFLKSSCEHANEIIKNVIKAQGNYDLKISGKLSKIKDIDNYCSKYFVKNNNAIKNVINTSIYDWNESFVSVKNHSFFFNIVNNKINPEVFYYNNEVENYDNNESFKKEVQSLKVSKKDLVALC